MVKRELHALVLALVGGTLLKLAITGDYQRYVKVGLRPYLIVAAVVVLAVGAVSLWQAVAARRSPDHDHDHAHGRCARLVLGRPLGYRPGRRELPARAAARG